MSLNAQPKRGEIWRIDFDPTVGTEIRKTRPAIVISTDSVGKLPIKLVAPITGWDTSFTGDIWHIPIEPNAQNNLTKRSAIDTLQLRGLDTERFISRIGEVSEAELAAITLSVAAVIGLRIP